MNTAAVTGTNGKTSSVQFARQLLEAAGVEAASLGTLGLVTSRGRNPDPVLPPGASVVPCFLDELSTAGTDVVLLEAFSRNLAAGLLDGLDVDVGAFTTFDRDHLDLHGTSEAYFRSKRRLFERVVAPRGRAVLNAETPVIDALRSTCRARCIDAIEYGAGTDVALRAAEPSPRGTVARIACFGRVDTVELPLVGRFMLENVLCALGLCAALDAPLPPVLDALPGLRAPVGRMERVATWRGAHVYVDYAHTPGALDAVLTALRARTTGRLSVVFGCGGDPGKRPLMGAVADRLADRVVVTDHTPTRDDTRAVRRDILAACPTAYERPGRARAVADAVAKLDAGDVLVVAGHGHERFDDEDGTSQTDHDLVRRAVQNCAQRHDHDASRRALVGTR